MAAVSDGELPTVEQLLPTARDGGLLVTVDDDDRPVALVLNDWVDARAHLDQASVGPAFAGHGIGRQLMAAAEQWGRQQTRRP
ncbi:GNAT family N-acetyltransferase [Leekyejoonella antrihumi]|uniref:GNAT family N-acetyltransferase n=1 Tax=Leekyejoonella antrihumi TaxID=1660198 RepID=UPI003CCC4F12